eukprot:6172616-Pleurochrysis_carterae.AAC.2
MVGIVMLGNGCLHVLSSSCAAPVGPSQVIGGVAVGHGSFSRKRSPHVHQAQHWLQPRCASTAF